MGYRGSVAAFVAGGGVLALAVYPLANAGLAQAGAFSLFGVACLSLLVWGLWRHGAGRSWPWRALAAGIALNLIGDLISFESGAGPFGSHWSDALYLSAFPVLFWGLLGFMRPRRLSGEGWLPQLADAGIVFLAGAAVLWVVTIDPHFDKAGLPIAERVLSIVYPLLDWAMLALLLRLVFSAGCWPPSYRLLVSAFVLMLGGDLVSRELVVRGLTIARTWIDVVSLAGYLLWALATLHPSVREIDQFTSPHDGSNRLFRRRVFLLGAFAVLPVTLVLHPHSGADDLLVRVVVVVGVPLLTVMRVWNLLGRLEQQAQESGEAHEDLTAVLEASPVPICVVDENVNTRVWNAAAERVSGWSREEVLGQPPPVIPAAEPERVAGLYASAVAGTVHQGVEITLSDRDENPINVRFSTAPLGGGRRGVVVLFEDVTDEKRRTEAIDFLANHDPLTGLPNRRSFEQALAAFVGRASRGENVSLLMFDIDNFKLLNDSGGHAAGDQVLRDLAKRLQAQLRANDSFARLSGDEFAVLVPDDLQGATRLADRLLDAVRGYRLISNGNRYDVTISIGICQLQPDEAHERALARADEALYDAKTHGKNKHRTWNPAALLPTFGSSHSWSAEINDALKEDRLELFLQPIVALPDETVVFHEALCRLRATDGSYTEPATFLPYAERLGQMPAIDRRMIDLAATLLADEPLRIFVNLSPSSFNDDVLIAHLADILERFRPGTLGIEITEQTSITDLSQTAAKLQELRTRGALIAIDDFGVGFSSFGELAAIPSDLIKIDGRFVRNISHPAAPDQTAIIQAITTVAHAHQRQVVIEGIEDKPAADLAVLLGIEYAQGWLYGRPQPSAPQKIDNQPASAAQ